MKKTLLMLALAAVLAVGAFALVGCGGAEPEPTDTATETPANPAFANLVKGGNTIVVATDAPYPPMEMVNDKGEYEGFDIDVYNAIAEKIGAKVEFMTFGFDALIAALSTGTKEFDSSISSITITEERAQNMLFSDPYYDANQSLAVTTGSPIKTTADLKSGDQVAVQLGTTGEIWAKENLVPKGIVLKPYDQVPGCFGALQAGDVVAVVCDLQVAGDYAKDPTRKCSVVEQISTGEQYGIGFAKGNEALAEEINKGLAAIVADGTYTEIYKKWFGVEPAALPQ